MCDTEKKIKRKRIPAEYKKLAHHHLKPKYCKSASYFFCILQSSSMNQTLKTIIYKVSLVGAIVIFFTIVRLNNFIHDHQKCRDQIKMSNLKRTDYITTIKMKMCTKKKYANTTFKVRKRHWLIFLRPCGLIGLFYYLLFITQTSSGKYQRILFQKAIVNG